MIVKIHPHRGKVVRGIEKCVSITPAVRGGRCYYKGTVLLRDAKFVIHQSGVKRAQAEQQRNVHAWCVGTLIEQDDLIIPIIDGDGFTKVTYHYNIARFKTMDGLDVTDMTFARAICSGRDFYVSL